MPALLDEVQQALYQRALTMRLERTVRLDDYAALLAAFGGAGTDPELGNPFVEAHWCGDPECEARVKAETRATIRNIPFDMPAEDGPCIVDGKPGIGQRVIFAKAY